MKNTLLILALVCTFQFVNAQKDSFWLRSLNLMGEPKAVFAIDDGSSFVLADSFDNHTENYKGIVFIKFDVNGKIIKRKQLFKLDTTYIEQRLEKAEKLKDGYLFRWYYTFNKNDSVVSSKSYFAKIDKNGDVLQNVETVVNYYGKAGIYWWRLNNDTIIDLPFYSNFSKNNRIRYTKISNGLAFDSIPRVNYTWLLGSKNGVLIYSDYQNIQNKYDSVWIVKTNWKYDTITHIANSFNSKLRLRINRMTKVLDGSYVFHCVDNSIIKTDTNLNIIWQSSPAFAEANIEPYLRDLRVLKNGDVLVFGDAYNSILRVPYVSRISSDGKSNYFKYHYPSPLDKFYDFDEGPKGELFFLSGSRLSQAADSIWLIKASRFGRTVSVNEPLETDFISIYPNPANEILNIQFNNTTNGYLELRDVESRLLFTSEIKNQNKIALDVSQFPKGIYNIILNSNNGEKYYSKFIIE